MGTALADGGVAVASYEVVHPSATTLLARSSIRIQVKDRLLLAVCILHVKALHIVVPSLESAFGDRLDDHTK